jgi:hypothetical protein
MMKNFYDPDSEETVDPAKKDKFDRALKSHTKAEARKTGIVKKMFATFSSFLDESIRPVYTEIVTTKVNVAPWVNLRGEEQTTPLSYTVEAFEMCTLFWLRTVFQQDAAEQLLLYIQHHLKKSRKQSLRMFVARVKQLNNYVPHLPGVYFMSKATSNTVPANKLDEPGLAGLVLRMCPPSWQQQHNLIRNKIPQDLERLVQFLEQKKQWIPPRNPQPIRRIIAARTVKLRSETALSIVGETRRNSSPPTNTVTSVLRKEGRRIHTTPPSVVSGTLMELRRSTRVSPMMVRRR